MEQVVEVPVVQTLRDTVGELIQESHWVSRWKGYINTYRRQKVGLRALQLYVAVIHTYGRCCPHHLLNGAVWMSVWGINTVCVALGACDMGHIAITWLPPSPDMPLFRCWLTLIFLWSHHIHIICTCVGYKKFSRCIPRQTAWYKPLLKDVSYDTMLPRNKAYYFNVMFS